jgi:replicative DNA helicase
MSDKLTKDYIYELVACCIKNKKVLDICHSYLKYEYLQTEAQKRVVKHIFDTYSLTNVAPTFGGIAQTFSTNTEIINFLAKVKDVQITDNNELAVLDVFETFVKDMKFQHLYHKIAKLYNDNQQDEAIQLLAKESQDIAEFSIKRKRFMEVFSQFNERMDERVQKANSDEAIGTRMDKCVTGIHEFDYLSKGYRRGSSFLCMAQSGVGKSTYLRWVGIANARLGKIVVLFQGEEKADDTMATIDAALTGVTMDNVETGDIPEDLKPRIKKVIAEIQNRGGKIYVVASEQFEKMTIEECNDILDEIEKIEGHVDLVLWDYLELFSTKKKYGTSESSERRRREDIAEKITAIAVQRNCVTGTATQSNDVKTEDTQRADFVLTHNHCSEFKGVIKPFSYFFTFNVTRDEYEAQTLRIWLDKMRKSKAKKVIKIQQARDIGRFYDAAQTKIQWYDYNAVNIR